MLTKNGALKYEVQQKPMKKRNVFLKLRRCDAYPSIKLHHCQTLQSMIPTKLWKVFRRRHTPAEKKHLMSKHLIKNLTKYK